MAENRAEKEITTEISVVFPSRKSAVMQPASQKFSHLGAVGPSAELGDAFGHYTRACVLACLLVLLLFVVAS
jgi:hypothetical protein